jgi:hypothetical protein
MPKIGPSVEQIAKSAARAYSDINIFGVVSKMLEGSDLLSADHRKAADEIVAICEREISAAIDRYDADVAKLRKAAETGAAK